MQKSQLLAVLHTFSAGEWRRFGQFLRSPYYNQREDVAKLYEYLRETVRLHGQPPEKASAWRAAYGKRKAYDDRALRIAMSRLHKLAQDFLFAEQAGADEAGKQTALAALFRQRRLDAHFKQACQSAAAQIERSPLRDEGYYYANYRLLREEYAMRVAQSRDTENNLPLLLQHLDYSYLAAKLREVCLAMAHQSVYPSSYEPGLLQPLLHYIDQQALYRIPAVGLYYYCYQFLSEEHPSEEGQQAFQRFQALLAQQDGTFPSEALRDLYLLAANYCLKQYNEGNAALLEDLLRLYQAGLQRGHLLQDGFLSRYTYRNIVTLGLILKVYDWVAVFLEDYRPYLEKAWQESMYDFCAARLAYAQGDYSRTIDLLQQADYEDLLLNLSAKTVLLKVYYEMGAFDLLDAHLEAMRNFLRRKPQVGYHRENYRHIIRFTRRLMQLPVYGGEARTALREEVLAAKAVAEREWLLEKIG